MERKQKKQKDIPQVSGDLQSKIEDFRRSPVVLSLITSFIQADGMILDATDMIGIISGADGVYIFFKDGMELVKLNTAEQALQLISEFKKIKGIK